MDLSFFRRAQTRFASRSAARLDYGVLVATLEAMQSASAAARALRGLGAEGKAAPRHDGLVELLLGGPAGAKRSARSAAPSIPSMRSGSGGAVNPNDHRIYHRISIFLQRRRSKPWPPRGDPAELEFLR